MNPWRAWRQRALAGAERAALAAWNALPAPDLDRAPAALRCIVLDTETSGLDPSRDRLLSLGAFAIEGGAIACADAIDLLLRQERASDEHNIVVHGLGVAEQLCGEEPRAALLRFLAWSGKAPLIAYHAPFDAAFLARCMERHLGHRHDAVWLDLAGLLPELFDAKPGAGLDDWLLRFGIEAPVRHAALGDALATAQLAQVAFAHAAERGLLKFSALLRATADGRWLRRR